MLSPKIVLSPIKISLWQLMLQLLLKNSCYRYANKHYLQYLYIDVHERENYHLKINVNFYEV